MAAPNAGIALVLHHSMIRAPHVLAKCCEDPLMYRVCCTDNIRDEKVSTVNGGCIPSTEDVIHDQEDSSQMVQMDENSHRIGMAQRYGAIFVCLTILERWLELAIRPTRKVSDDISTIFCMSHCWMQRGRNKDDKEPASKCIIPLNEILHNLLKNPLDDLMGIKNLVNETRRFLWRSAMEPSQDDHLTVAHSKIPMAEQGLFAACHLPADTICCYYSGDVHSSRSSQSSFMLPDPSYLLRIGTLSLQPWWHETLSLGIHQAYYENQSGVQKSTILLAAVFLSLRDQWDQIMCDASKVEFYVDHSTNLNSKARFINDCLQEDSYNVKFVLDERTERAQVVTLREIEIGEELYVSYGQAYWDSQEATTGIVPQSLMGSSTVNRSIRNAEFEST
jgi:SET domain